MNKHWSPETSKGNRPAAALIFILVIVSTLLLYTTNDSLHLSSGSLSYNYSPSNPTQELEAILKRASMANNNVIITSLNAAWAAPGSIFDIFLESFKLGNGTRRLLDHLVVFSMDEKAYNRCRTVHKHCYAVVNEDVDFNQEARFMTPNYLKLVWRKPNLLRTVLEFGYNFVFTDADIIWFRDPFPRFFPDADVQIACDFYLGKPDDMNNRPNTGFMYVKSNNRSIEFFKFWNSTHEKFPELHDQEGLNKIKFDPYISEIGVKVRFLDTFYFGGLCSPSRDLNVVCTMHVNCCVGMDRKINDLRLMLEDWRAFKSLPQDLKNQSIISWRAPRYCKM